MPAIWIFLIFTVIILLGVGIISANFTIVALAVSIVITAVIIITIYRFFPAKVTAELDFPQNCEISETTAGIITIANNSFVPYTFVKVYTVTQNALTQSVSTKIIHMSLSARGKSKIPFKINSGLCGNVEITVKYVKLYDLLGLTYRTFYLNADANMLVLPNVFPVDITVKGSNITQGDGCDYRSDICGYDMSEVFDFRDYKNGDSPRNIHWKLTSKYNKLIVKQGSQPLENSVIILFNNIYPASPKGLAYVAQALVSVSQTLSESHIVHTIMWYSSKQGDITYQLIETEDDLAPVLPKLLTSTDKDNSIFDYIDAELVSSFAHIVCFTEKIPDIACEYITFITTDNAESNNCYTVADEGFNGLNIIEI